MPISTPHTRTIWHWGALSIGLLAAGEVLAESAAIGGTWSGQGRVQLSTGAHERVRCRATFTPEARRVVFMSARCATSSFSVAQTAELERQSDVRYTGTFHNAEYGVSGRIVVQIAGNSLLATLIADGGSAEFRLSR